jgi:ATP-dependent DNA ligase
MTLAIPRSFEPMEAVPVDSLPVGKGWQFEPKWDGFRCIVFRDGNAVYLQSRNQKPLGRYFPELEARPCAPGQTIGFYLRALAR